MFYELIWTWVFVFCLCFPGIFSKIPLNSPKFLTKWRQKSWNLWLQWKSIVTLLVSPQDTSDEGRGLTLLEKARMSLGEGSGWGWPPSLPNCFRRKGLRGGGCTQKVGFWIGGVKGIVCVLPCLWPLLNIPGQKPGVSPTTESPSCKSRTCPFLNTHGACPQLQAALLPLLLKSSSA